MEPLGGSLVQRKWEEIVEAFTVYFGEITQAELGINQGEMPEMPDAFLWNLHSQMVQFNRLPLAGGLLDQPYLLMRELSAIDHVVTIRQVSRPNPFPAQ